MKMPHSIKNTIEITLMASITRVWEWRNDSYWRDALKKKIAALRLIRKL